MTQAAIMQGTRQEHARSPALVKRIEVGGMAHAAGCEYLAPIGPGDKSGESFKIRSKPASHPGKCHDDDFAWPKRSVGEHGLRTDEAVVAKIERQNGRIPDARGKGTGGQALAADYGHSEPACLPFEEGGAIGDAGVGPYFDAGETPMEAFDCCKVVATRLDRIEVGKVEAVERVKVEERGDNVSGRAARTKLANHRPVAGPIASQRADDFAAKNIDNGNQAENHGGAIKRIFVYEHVTGGGLADQALPASLLSEGSLMLEAMVDDLITLGGMEIVVTRDCRLGPMREPVRTLRVGPGEDIEVVLRRGLNEADAIWPVAPESDGVLERVCRFANACGTVVIGSTPGAIRVSASKSATADILARQGIAVVPTYRTPAEVPDQYEDLVIKPDDGAGCVATLLFSRTAASAWWSRNGSNRFVVQPYIAGEALSLSILCAAGAVDIISCNTQRVRPVGGIFEFRGVVVNADPVGRQTYRGLASAIAGAIPGLWGYVGIDLIETSGGPVVVEINPRVTTSYAGLTRALGINTAARILAMRADGMKSLPPLPVGTRVEIETGDADE
jgi:predicted ATP-grasp superfamily ATP-dependent carboligase